MSAPCGPGLGLGPGLAWAWAWPGMRDRTGKPGTNRYHDVIRIASSSLGKVLDKPHEEFCRVRRPG